MYILFVLSMPFYCCHIATGNKIIIDQSLGLYGYTEFYPPVSCTWTNIQTLLHVQSNPP